VSSIVEMVLICTQSIVIFTIVREQNGTISDLMHNSME